MVIARSKNAIEQIFINAPLHPEGFGYLQHPVNGSPIAGMDVCTPFHIIAVGVMAQQGKAIKIQVIMGIDQARKSNSIFEMQYRQAAGRITGRTFALDIAIFDKNALRALVVVEVEVIEQHLLFLFACPVWLLLSENDF